MAEKISRCVEPFRRGSPVSRQTDWLALTIARSNVVRRACNKIFTENCRFFSSKPSLSSPTLVGKALSFTYELFYLPFLFLSIHRIAAQWMAIKCIPEVPSYIFNNWYRDLAHPSRNFQSGQKVRNLVSFATLLKFEQPAFENAARCPNSEIYFFCRNNRLMFLPNLVKLGPRTPENRSVTVPQPIKLKTC